MFLYCSEKSRDEIFSVFYVGEFLTCLHYLVSMNCRCLNFWVLNKVIPLLSKVFCIHVIKMKKIHVMNYTLVKKTCVLNCGKSLVLIPLDSNNTISRF